jgi:hypothetical protein
MSELVKFLRQSNPLELCSDQFPTRLSQPGGINKDPTVLLDGARPLSRYSFKINMRSISTDIGSTQTLQSL